MRRCTTSGVFGGLWRGRRRAWGWSLGEAGGVEGRWVFFVFLFIFNGGFFLIPNAAEESMD